MAFFDFMQKEGGLFGAADQFNRNKLTPYVQNNQNALMGAGLALLGGDGYSGAARGFMAGGLADSQRATNAQQSQMAQQRFAMEKERLKMAQAEHQQRTTAAERLMGQQNQTDALIAQKYPELVGLPREVQLKALSEKFAGGSNKGSLVPVPGLDAEGNFTYLQPRADGTMGQFKTPDGITPLSPYEKSFETKAGGKAGELQAEADQNLRMVAPGIEDAAQKARELLTVDADKDGEPDYKAQIGPFDAWVPTVSGTGKAWHARLKQLSGKAFLAARQELKGGGAITDFESQKAEDALLRAETAQSETEFKNAVQDFIQALEVGRQKLAAAANKKVSPLQPQEQSDWQTLPNGVRIREKR